MAQVVCPSCGHRFDQEDDANILCPKCGYTEDKTGTAESIDNNDGSVDAAFSSDIATETAPDASEDAQDIDKEATVSSDDKKQNDNTSKQSEDVKRKIEEVVKTRHKKISSGGEVLGTILVIAIIIAVIYGIYRLGSYLWGGDPEPAANQTLPVVSERDVRINDYVDERSLPWQLNAGFKPPYEIISISGGGNSPEGINQNQRRISIVIPEGLNDTQMNVMLSHAAEMVMSTDDSRKNGVTEVVVDAYVKKMVFMLKKQ